VRYALWSALCSLHLQNEREGLPCFLWCCFVYLMNCAESMNWTDQYCHEYTPVVSIAVSPILADPDMNNCAEQMHDSHPSGRIRPLDQSEVVRTVGCSCPDRPDLGRLQYKPAVSEYTPDMSPDLSRARTVGRNARRTAPFHRPLGLAAVLTFDVTTNRAQLWLCFPVGLRVAAAGCALLSASRGTSTRRTAAICPPSILRLYLSTQDVSRTTMTGFYYLARTTTIPC